MSGGAEQVLRNGLRSLNLDLVDRQIEQLLAYLAMIGKWTQVYNLTAVRDPAEMMTHHLLDSLAVAAPVCDSVRRCSWRATRPMPLQLQPRSERSMLRRGAGGVRGRSQCDG